MLSALYMYSCRAKDRRFILKFCFWLQLRKKEREELERQQIAQQKAEALPPEVLENAPEPNILCLFRWPNGSRDQRRFKLDDPVSQVFDFVDSKVCVFSKSYIISVLQY